MKKIPTLKEQLKAGIKHFGDIEKGKKDSTPLKTYDVVLKKI